jgi:hypothetical protein
VLNFKLALQEIFETEMETGGDLYNLCDGVLASSVAPLPKSYNKFITLGEYSLSDVMVGELRHKYRVLELDIDCGAVVRAGKKNAEANAEEAAYLLAIAVRTILIDNKTLVSTTYPSGLAKISEPLDETLQYVIYDGSNVALNTITYLAKIVET